MLRKFQETDTFRSLGIYGETINSYARENIVVGENGAGKTRFLRGVKDYFLNKLHYKDSEVVYSYFPDVHASVTEVECSLDYSLFDSFFQKNNMGFDDFLRGIEADNMEFISEILNPHNKRYHEKFVQCQKAHKDLNEVLKQLLGVEISSGDNVIKLIKKDGKESSLKEGVEIMSPGERMLFYLAIYIMYIAKVWNKNGHLILILDEPELHLHTKVLNKFISLLRERIDYEQLWIATHSYPLVAQFDFESLIYMEQGEIKRRSSSLYEFIYQSLVGFDDDKLYDFLLNIETWKYYNFIAECFSLPEAVAESHPEDVQIRQFVDCIKTIRSMKKGVINVLDYGSGKERLRQCLDEIRKEQPNSIVSDVKYHAYEPILENKDLNEWRFNRIDQIISKRKLFDCVVMMNVLHEIDIKEWYTVFMNIDRILDENGMLLLMEVETLTYGEQPYGDSGYLILYEEQLKILFGSQNIMKISIVNDNHKSNAFIITKEQIRHVTYESIKKTLESLRQRTLEELSVLYKDRINIAHKKRGAQSKSIIRRYAYISQLYFNVKFALESMSNYKAKNRLDNK